MRRFLPSPSMIVALTALVVALGGSAYAAVQISGSSIRNGTITGSKIKKNSLTGKQIKESSLGTVRSATHASTATHATTADAATHATSADNATHATTADSATNASSLGGTAASGFVQGGGQTYADGAAEAENTNDTAVLTIPGVGSVLMGCSSTGNTDFILTNATGATVQLTEASNNFLSGTGQSSDSGGKVAASGDDLLSDIALTTGQTVLSADWPAGAATHGANLTFGWFRDSSNKCELNVTGFIK
jgi:hypothetical protein